MTWAESNTSKHIKQYSLFWIKLDNTQMATWHLCNLYTLEYKINNMFILHYNRENNEDKIQKERERYLLFCHPKL